MRRVAQELNWSAQLSQPGVAISTVSETGQAALHFGSVSPSALCEQHRRRFGGVGIRGWPTIGTRSGASEAGWRYADTP